MSTKETVDLAAPFLLGISEEQIGLVSYLRFASFITKKGQSTHTIEIPGISCQQLSYQAKFSLVVLLVKVLRLLEEFEGFHKHIVTKIDYSMCRYLWQGLLAGH